MRALLNVFAPSPGQHWAIGHVILKNKSPTLVQISHIPAAAAYPRALSLPAAAAYRPCARPQRLPATPTPATSAPTRDLGDLGAHPRPRPRRPRRPPATPATSAPTRDPDPGDPTPTPSAHHPRPRRPRRPPATSAPTRRRARTLRPRRPPAAACVPCDPDAHRPRRASPSDPRLGQQRRSLGPNPNL